jgi:hypothetical protein
MFNLSLVYNVEVYACRQISEAKLFLLEGTTFIDIQQQEVDN